MLHALRDTNGGTVAIEESEIIEASLNLARQGLYAEPTSAHAAAAFTKLSVENHIGEDEETVVILTGSGLKATAFYTAQFDSK